MMVLVRNSISISTGYITNDSYLTPQECGVKYEKYEKICHNLQSAQEIFHEE